MLTHGTWLQNRYRIESLLDMGGTGASYRAWDTRYELAVKLKELTPQPDISADLLAQLRQQLIAEARMLTRVHHQHLAQVLDFFEENGHAYVVTDFVDGASLADWVKQHGPVPENQALAWAEQVLAALAYLHSLAGVHRNIKPQNIIIGTNGEATLVDFGLSPLWDPRNRRTWAATEVMGTPEYASPEQWGLQLSPVDARSDVYSMGATWYYALTGAVPPTANARMQDPFSFASIEETQPNMPATLLAITSQAMKLRRNLRFADATAMLNALKYGPSAAPEVKPAALIVRQMPSWAINLALALSVLALGLLSGDALPDVSSIWLPAWTWWLGGLLGVTGLGFGIHRRWRRRPSTTAQVPTWLKPPRRRGLWLDFKGTLRALAFMSVVLLLALGMLVGRWWFLSPPAPSVAPTITAVVPLSPTRVPATTTRIPPTATPPPTRTPTLVPAPTLPPLVSLAEIVPLTWTVAFSDTFNDNVSGWLTTGAQSAWGTLTRTITHSLYRWEVDAVQSVGLFATSEVFTTTDFHLRLDAQRLSGPEDAEYGVVLRYHENSYYSFMLRDDGYFRFDVWADFAWAGLLDWTETLAIQPGQINHIGVTGTAERFELYINDVQVAIVNDATLSVGEVGVAVGITSSGAATFTFDNLWVYVPPHQ